jgi:predicted nucleotidyltransferase
MINAKIKVPKSKLISFCQKWKIVEFSIFGSALRSDFRPDSDVDVLVSFTSDAHPTLSDMARMTDELKEIFGRDVDLISRRGIETSRNFIRRKAILESAEVIYAAR